jgi:hypothetical protein
MNLVVEKSDHGTATLSKDGRYRYILTRRWSDSGETALWVMLNPSVATASEDDPTIVRCIGFSKGFGASALTVVNLFALRATDPKKLLKNPQEALGPRNQEILEEVLKSANRVIVAWGALSNKLWMASLPSRDVIRKYERLQCLGKTKRGAPRHPLYLRADSPLLPWS